MQNISNLYRRRKFKVCDIKKNHFGTIVFWLQYIECKTQHLLAHLTIGKLDRLLLPFNHTPGMYLKDQEAKAQGEQ